MHSVESSRICLNHGKTSGGSLQSTARHKPAGISRVGSIGWAVSSREWGRERKGRCTAASLISEKFKISQKGWHKADVPTKHTHPSQKRKSLCSRVTEDQDERTGPSDRSFWGLSVILGISEGRGKTKWTVEPAPAGLQFESDRWQEKTRGGWCPFCTRCIIEERISVSKGTDWQFWKGI